jgi:hypothetical protein
MEAHLHQLGVYRICSGAYQAPDEPDYTTPAIPAVKLTREARAVNATLKVSYVRAKRDFLDCEEKAAGDILAHLSCSEQVHSADTKNDARAMWEVLHAIHVQKVPGTRFSAYSELFSIAKGPDEILPAVATRVKKALARVRELRPATVMSIDKKTGSPKERPYVIEDLDSELATMAMLCALPREGYGDITSSLMRQKDPQGRDVEAAFQVEQTERDSTSGPLLVASGDAALHASSSKFPPPQNLPGVVCAFCGNNGHEEGACFARIKAQKAAQELTKEKKAGKKDCQRANRAVKEASKDSTPTELAASASLRLPGSPDAHADAHWIADTGATSYMSPRQAWFTSLEPLAVPIRIANDQVVYSKDVGTVCKAHIPLGVAA